MTHFITYFKIEKGLSKNTLTSYYRDLNGFKNFLFSQKIFNVNNIAKNNIIQYLIKITTRGMQPQSQNRLFPSIRQFFRFLLKEKVLKKPPITTINMLKAPKKTPLFLTIKKAEHLLLSIERNYLLANTNYQFVFIKKNRKPLSRQWIWEKIKHCSNRARLKKKHTIIFLDTVLPLACFLLVPS